MAVLPSIASGTDHLSCSCLGLPRFEQPGHRHADLLIEGSHPPRKTSCHLRHFGLRKLAPSHLGMAEMQGCASEALNVCAVRSPADALAHSTGGLGLLANATEHPARIKRLVLVSQGERGGSLSEGAWRPLEPKPSLVLAKRQRLASCISRGRGWGHRCSCSTLLKDTPFTIRPWRN